MGKVKKPTSITTIKECEEALEWIDLELDKLDRNIRITSRAIFSPKKWTTAISGILWSKQVKQKTSDHICNSPFLSKLEGSARSDQSLQEIQLSRVMNTAKEVQAVCEETCSRLSGAVNEARAAVDQPIHVDDRNISTLPEADREAIKQHDKAVQVAKREAAARQVESELSAWTAMQTREPHGEPHIGSARSAPRLHRLQLRSAQRHAPQMGRAPRKRAAALQPRRRAGHAQRRRHREGGLGNEPVPQEDHPV